MRSAVVRTTISSAGQPTSPRSLFDIHGMSAGGSASSCPADRSSSSPIAGGEHNLGQLVAAKVRRAGILHEGTRRIVHVLGEAALRTRIGSQTLDTLRAQLAHLADIATLPGHEFGVIPFTVVLPIEPASGFVVYDQDLVVVEHAGGDLQLGDPEEVARYVRWLDLLLDVATIGAEAAEFCRRVATERS